MPVLLGVLFWLLTSVAGYAVVRLARGADALAAIGLAAPAGLALLAVVTTWTSAAHAPPLVSTLICGVPVVLGLALLTRTSVRWLSQDPEPRYGLALLGLALATSALLMAAGFAGVDAPLSTHDGANHVETIDAARHGALLPTWYPTGLHTTVAAFLNLVPFADTAEGSFGASLGLTLLAIQAVYGLGWTVWRRPLVAGAGALALALTFEFPYHVHFWGGWPLAASIVVLLGLLAIAIQYVRQPSWSLAALAGLLLAGIVLIHGTELYSLAPALALILATHAVGAPVRLRSPGQRVGGSAPRAITQPALHATAALLVAVLLTAPYLPTLLHWAATGGASAVGEASAQAAAASGSDSLAQTENQLIQLANTFGTGVGLDLPVRLALLSVGIVQALRTPTGRAITAMGALFLALALAFSALHTPWLDAVFAITFPWAQAYRLLMITAVASALLQGLGAVVMARAWLAARITHLRPVRALESLLVMGLGVGSLASLGLLLAANARVYASTSPDDAAAMSWLRTHARPGELVANDGFADAGIWAPYKAGTPVLLTRLGSDGLAERQAVLDDVAHLDTTPDGQRAACTLDVRYIFRGARATAWDTRHFPPVDQLERAPALREVFASGGAVVFETHLRCNS